eukprot:s1720_g6.t1
MARVGRHGYVQRIAGYDTEEDDTCERYVSGAIFEIKFGQTADRATHKEEELTHARLHLVRACVYHVNQKRIDKSAGICGEAIATMVWECMKYQVDIIAGDGNKAWYYPAPAKPCVPTYENSLIQFWIDRLVGCATQERRRRFQGDAAPVRVKHVITASFTGLMFLKDKLFRITTDNYPGKLANETDKGDCCRMSIVERGHARLVLEEDLGKFDDQTHMDEVGEFTFQMNETCLHNDSNMFLLYPNDKDSHNPVLLHLTPFDVTHNEARQFIPSETNMKRKQMRKEIQRTNRRKKYDNTWEEDEEQDDEGPWLNRESWRDYTGNPYWTTTGQQLDNNGKTGHGVMTTLTGGIDDVSINALEKVKVPNNLVVVEKVVVVALHQARLRYGDLEDKLAQSAHNILDDALNRFCPGVSRADLREDM